MAKEINNNFLIAMVAIVAIVGMVLMILFMGTGSSSYPNNYKVVDVLDDNGTVVGQAMMTNEG